MTRAYFIRGAPVARHGRAGHRPGEAKRSRSKQGPSSPMPFSKFITVYLVIKKDRPNQVNLDKLNEILD
jgi:hypothetical protein